MSRLPYISAVIKLRYSSELPCEELNFYPNEAILQRSITTCILICRCVAAIIRELLSKGWRLTNKIEYRIVGKFGAGKAWQIQRIVCDLPNL